MCTRESLSRISLCLELSWASTRIFSLGVLNPWALLCGGPKLAFGGPLYNFEGSIHYRYVWHYCRDFYCQKSLITLALYVSKTYIV
jgi:hypothetical protein